MSEKNDLDILVPDKEITLGSGEVVVIRPFHFAKLPAVTGLINSLGVGIFTLLEGADGLTVSQDGGEEGSLEIDDLAVNKVNEFIQEHFTEITELMGIYCGRPKEFFLDEQKGPDIEEAIVIILTIVERHLGFFTKTLRPILARMRKQ